MSESIPEQPQPVSPPVFPLSYLQKLVYGALIVGAPILNFSLVGALEPEWQSGKTSDYVNLFLHAEASIFFFPLLAYAVISYILLLRNTERFARSFPVRFGIYTGMFLALQYSILTMVALDLPLGLIFVIPAYLSPFILIGIHRWLTKWFRADIVSNLAIAIGLVAFLALSILWRNPLAPLMFLLLIIGVAAPFWSFIIAGQASLWLLKHHEDRFTFTRGLGLLAWTSAYAYALRFDILKMYELYAALPPRPPDCYIATAAAKGHPRFVGSREIVLANGQSMRVNRQLQRLKAAELALMAAAPRVHAGVRRIYDSVGKKLGSRIKRPLSADAAYLLLKPFELMSTVILRKFIPAWDDLAAKIYRERMS